MIVGLFAIDSLRLPDVQSHMGQTAQLVSQGGLIERIDIAYRKISIYSFYQALKKGSEYRSLRR